MNAALISGRDFMESAAKELDGRTLRLPQFNEPDDEAEPV